MNWLKKLWWYIKVGRVWADWLDILDELDEPRLGLYVWVSGREYGVRLVGLPDLKGTDLSGVLADANLQYQLKTILGGDPCST